MHDKNTTKVGKVIRLNWFDLTFMKLEVWNVECELVKYSKDILIN